jgi:tetratricopeptide (TPR) repeat protein
MDPSSERAESSSRWRYWLSRIAVATLIPLLLLVSPEVALRICHVGFPASATIPCTDQGRPAFCSNQNFTVPFFPPGMARGARPYAIPAEKSKGTFRIFIIGESAAYGDPDPTYAFGRYLDVMLRERFPGVQFEVINTGITAINSHALLPIAEDSARHQPDLFIIYAGNNEVVGPYGPGSALASTASLSLPIIRANIFMRSTRTGQLVTRILEPKKLAWQGMALLNHRVRRDSPAMGHVYHNFERNLQDIVSVARGSGARVVLCTVATDLKDSAPFGSLHRKGLSQESLRSWTALVDEGTRLESAGGYAEALKLYQSAAKIDDQYADLQFRIARCLWNLQDYAGAKQHFILARDLDTLRFRADSRENDIIRSVAAASGQGVELLDMAEIFNRESPHGITGSELLYEHVHMNPEGNYLIARNLFPMVARALPSQVRNIASGDDIPSETECNRMLALTDYDRARVARLILNKIQRPPFTTQLNYAEELQRTTAMAEATNENWDDILSQYQWAIAKHPDDRLLHLNFAFLLYQIDPYAATEEFRKAMPYDNAPVLCNWRKLN